MQAMVLDRPGQPLQLRDVPIPAVGHGQVRLRVAARTTTRAEAEHVGNEVEALYTNGPAGGGGVRVHITEVLAIASILIPANDVQLEVLYEEV